MDDRLVVTLLRHGMTDENERSAYIGWTDSLLNQKGREMVRELRKHIRQPDLIFSSTSVRCLETAGILFPGEIMVRLDQLREMNFGDWEGKTYEDLQGLTSYRKWLDDPLSKGPDKGETFAEFSERVQNGWQLIKEKTLESGKQHVAVVTHGGVIRLLLSELAPGESSFFQWRVPLAGGYDIVWTKEGFRRDEPCISLQEVPTTEKANG